MHVVLDATGVEGRHGGISRHATHVATELVDLAPDDTFTLLASTGLDGDHPLMDVDEAANGEVRRVRTPPLGPRRQVTLARTLRGLAREGYDVLHTLRTEPPLYQPRPTVVTIHDLKYLADPSYLLGSSRLKAGYLRWTIGLGLRRAARTLAVSHHTKEDVLTHFGVDPDEVVVTPNATTMGTLAATLPEADDGDVLEAHDVTAPYLLWMGSFLPHKNLPTVLDAYARYRDRVADPADLVLVAGSGPKQDAYLGKAQDLGLRDHVHHLQGVDDEALAVLYRRAEAFVFVPLYEGFGIPVLEALAVGTPTITSATTATAEAAGEAALLVDPEDPEAVADAMERVREDDTLRARLREAGPDRADDYDWRATAETVLGVYREVRP